MPIILRPKDFKGLWGADPSRTQATLRSRQREFLAQNPAASAPVEFSDPIPAYIGNGAWRVRCVCGEATHANPEAHEAVCFGCGAIWTNVIVPQDADAIEALLVLRRLQGSRNWAPPETLDDLRAEQLEHGEPIS